MNKKLTGVLVAVGAAGAYFVYKNWDAIKAKFQGGAGGSITPGTGTSDKPETGNQAQTYAQKVEVLQGLLKVAIDGKPGNQTNGTLDFYYDLERRFDLGSHIAQAVKSGFANLKANGKGVVSPANVDFYIEQLQSAQAPRQKAWVNGGFKDAASMNRANFGKKLEAAYKRNEKVFASYSFAAAVKTFDKSRGAYVPTGKSVSIIGGQPLQPGLEFAYDENGYWMLRTKGSDVFTQINPYIFRQ